MFTPFCILSALAVAACSAASSPPLPPTRSVNKIKINDVERSYILRLPPKYDGKTKLPMVMLLNGANDSAAYAEEAYHFAEKADAENFVLVLPDALGEFHAWSSSGNIQETKDDLAFLSTLLESLPQQYAIDPKRVYVSGHSAGAAMAYRLTCEQSEKIAAAGIVAGWIGSEAHPFPTPKVPVPIIMFHGRKDDVIPYGKDDPKNPGTVAENLAFWIKADACDPKPSKTDRPVPTVERKVFSSKSGAEVVLYSLDNGNHMWPGGKVMPGKTMIPVQDISATDLMWDFFKSHPRS